MQKIGLEAILKMANFRKGLNEYSSGVQQMNTETKAASGILQTVGTTLGTIGLVAGTAGAAMFALKKVMDLAKEGATVAQTEKSFRGLMTSMGKGPGVLEEMRAATLNTVDDMTLMSSTMTLLAGTSDELGGAMVNAAPQLLTIAKAANKLNPTLGDTAFLYQSLATGIKRSSPLILDNLGLTLKIGDANEKMAKSLGKTVEQLTAEEKQLGLLEATLEAGDRMIEQAGGNVAALGDEIYQLDVKMKNATDRIKADFGPAIADLLGTVAEEGPAIADTANEVVSLMEAGMAWVSAAVSGKDATEAWERSLAGLSKADQALIAEAKALAQAYGTDERRFVAADRALEDLNGTMQDATFDSKELAKVQTRLAQAIDEARKSYEGFLGTLAGGVVKLRDLGKASRDSAEEYQKALERLENEASQVYKDIKLDFEASLPNKTSIRERMGMAADAWDEWGLRLQDIIQNGIASPWYETLLQMGYEKPPDVGVVQWAQDLQNQFYKGELPDLINAQSAAWQENTEKMKSAQAEATAAYNTEIANRKAALEEERAALEEARQAQLEAEREARNRATLELALNLAEQSQQLQAWSAQRFGPDFGQVADTAEEVLALLDSGMLDVDDALQAIISNSVSGVQQALDTTGEQAEETKGLLDEIVTTDWAAERQRLLLEALDPDIMPLEELRAKSLEMGMAIDDGIPKTPFDPFLTSFEGSSDSILREAANLGGKLEDEFGDIESEWAAMVKDVVGDWEKGMGTVGTAIQEKILDKLAEIPTQIVITVIPETPPGLQYGGPVTGGNPYIVGEAGPELFIPQQSGMIVPSSDISQSFGGDTFNMYVSSPQAWGMAQKWVDSRRRDRLNTRM